MTPGKVLIVEDEVMLAKELERGLQRAGYHVVGRAITGEAAVAMAVETQPDLILMDIKLRGEMDGIEASTLISSRLDTAIVYLTAHTASDAFERAKLTEPYAYLSKPVSPHELGRTVETVLYKRQLHKKLKENEARYKSLVENMSNAVAIYEAVDDGADFIFADFNAAGERIERLRRDSVIGRSILDVFPAVKDFGLYDVIQRVWRTGVPQHHAISQYKDQRIEGWRENFVYKLPSGEIVAVYSDETARKQAEEALLEERDKSQRYLDTARIMIIAFNLDGTVSLVNQKACETLGFRESEMLGKDWFKSFVPRRCRDEVEYVFRELVSGNFDQFAYYENLIVTKQGEERLIAWHNTRVRDDSGKIVEVLTSGEDITDRRKAEEALNYRIELERIVTTISTRFISIGHNQNDEPINRALKELGEFACADRSYVFRFSEDGSTIDNTHEWCADGIESQINNLQGVCVDTEIPWFSERIRRGEVFHVPSVADLPEAAAVDKKHFELQQIKSLIVVPIMSRNELLGFIGFDSVRSQRAWTAEELSSLRLIGVILANAFERQKADSLLKTSWAKYRHMFENIQDVYYEAHLDGTILEVSPSVERISGYRRDELIGNSLLNIHGSEEQRSRVLQAIRKYGLIEDYEVVALDRDGTPIQCAITARLICDNAGKPLKTCGTLRDISDRKKMEADLIKSETRFRMIYEWAPVMMHSIDRNGVIRNVNNKWLEEIGYQKDEVIGRSIDMVLTDGSREHLHSVMPSFWRRGRISDVAYTYVRKNGTMMDVVLDSVVVADNEWGEVSLSVIRDVTDQKRMEAELRESEQRYRTLFERAGDGIIVVDVEGDQAGKIVSANHVAAEMHGYQIEEFLTLSMSDLDTPEEANRMTGLFRQIRQGQLIKTEHYHARKDGTVLHIELSAGLIEIDGHKYSLSINRDITERKKAEAERLLLAKAIEQAAESVEIVDSDGRIVYVNPAFERTSGYSRTELVGQRPSVLAAGKNDEALYREMWATIKNGEIWTGNLINKRKDGKLFEEEVTISPVKDEFGRSVNYVAVKRDVTNEVLLQKQLLEAQKMEAVGTLAGGIAHDFNNLLQIISGFAEMALFDITENQTGYSELNEIRHAARSAAELTQGLLTFSRRVENKLRPVDLNQELERLTRMLNRTLPKMIKIEMNLAEPLCTVNADPAQLQQVVMNLAVNARDAMDNGGTLLIETKNVYLDEEYCESHLGASPGNYVRLTISDSGIGMDEETRKHIFDPFFSTKEIGKGTGLGLSIAFGIVKGHGGDIICDTEPGAGTSFSIYLPALAAPHRETRKGHVSALAGGNETILLVEDEEPVQRLATQMLEKVGYSVLTATNGKEGVEVFFRHREQIDLVILDLIMPEMGGRDCLRRILKSAPDTKVIVASGYAADGEIDAAVKEGARASIRKPYLARQMLETIRTILDEDCPTKNLRLHP